MHNIIEEYGEAILGAIAALLIMGIAFFVFKDGGLLEQIFSNYGNSSI